MSKDKLVSVIMPVYNIKTSFLMASIDSILNQTYHNIELIVVDSSDKEDICNLLRQKDDRRIHYYFREKNGISDALNYGLNIAKGEFIARMDGDDIALPLRLEKQVAFLERHSDIDVVGTYFDRMDIDGNMIENKNLSGTGNYEAIKSNMIFDNPIGHPTIMFRKKVIDAGWRYRNVYGEDYDLWTRMLPSVKFANLEEVLLRYRQYEDSISFTRSRYKIVSSVVTSTKKYLEELLHLDISKNKDMDFAKNYYLYFFSNEIGKELTGYIMRQFCLLYQIYLKNQEIHAIEELLLVNILNKRWKTIIELTDFILPEVNNIYECAKSSVLDNHFFVDSTAKTVGCKTTDYGKLYEILSGIFYKNEQILKEIFSEEKNFLIYGMGEQGRLVLKRCERLANENKLLWNLKGIVDRRKLEVTFLDHTYSTISKEEIKDINYDYIIISSAWYFEDIKKELLQLGVKESAVIRDNGLYLID